MQVRRSARRRRTVSAYERDDGVLVVLVPDHLTAAQEADWVDRMQARLDRRRAAAPTSDEALAARAEQLSRAYLQGRARPASVVWSTRQERRWGSCSPTPRTIRISNRVADLPGWVLDYVLLHELAHLLQPGHGPAFWALLAGYPRLERARGYLEGVAAAGRLGWDEPHCGDEPGPLTTRARG